MAAYDAGVIGPDSRGGLGGSCGEVAEWSKANDSKSFEGQPSVGSNPTLSVSDLKTGIPEDSRDVPIEPEIRCTAVGIPLCGHPVRSRRRHRFPPIKDGRRPDPKRCSSMNSSEFGQRFTAGNPLLDSLDLTAARCPRQEQKRVNVDFPVWMVEELDRDASRLGVTRQSIIKVWLAERLEN